MRDPVQWLNSAKVSIVLKTYVLLQRLGIVSFYQPVPQLGIHIEPGMEARAEERWQAIRRELPAPPLTVLDIGCNVGYYCINMAEAGHEVTGIDYPLYSRFAAHAKAALGLPNLTFTPLVLTPDNVRSLPAHDCILLLSVFHHWCRDYGTEPALAMLDEVYRRTRLVLFFATLQTDRAAPEYSDVLPDMGDAPERWPLEHFRQKGCREVKTLAPFPGRPLFAIYK